MNNHYTLFFQLAQLQFDPGEQADRMGLSRTSAANMYSNYLPWKSREMATLDKREYPLR
jgi:hypothetical protein